MKPRLAIRIILSIIAIAAILFILHSRADTTPVVSPRPGVLMPTSVPEPSPAQHQLSYHLLTFVTDKPGKELSDTVGNANVGTVLALNRLDEQHMDKGKTVVIPDSFDDQEAFESFPLTIPALKEVPKIMLVSQRLQAFALYENGDRIRSGPVSTGKKSTPSPSKLYFTNWKGKLVTSSIDDEWIMPWYFNLDNKLGVSMHQYDLPGYPASHACIRMYEWDAKFIYDWADQWKVSDDGESVLAHGTPVLLFGEYAYGKTAPWKTLPDNPSAIKVSEDELTAALGPNMARILPSVSQE